MKPYYSDDAVTIYHGKNNSCGYDRPVVNCDLWMPRKEQSVTERGSAGSPSPSGNPAPNLDSNRRKNTSPSEQDGENSIQLGLEMRSQKRLDDHEPSGDIKTSGRAFCVEARNQNDTTQTGTRKTTDRPTLLSSADPAICDLTDESRNSASSRSKISQKLWLPAGVKPYYQDESVVIIHGDCREIVPTLGRFDLLLTDPPYGINYGNVARSRGVVFGDESPFDPSILPLDKPTIVWGGNNFCRDLPIGGWLVWMKHTDPRFLANWKKSDAELAWTNVTRKILVHVELWSGAIRDNPEENGILLPHPTQKPIRLMKWCLSLLPREGTILDPFMGSGTTLRAAKDTGRKAIGIEIEERYCEIAAKRMSQGVLQLETCAMNPNDQPERLP